MTVATEIDTSGPYLGNGVQTVFPYDFLLLEETHVEVIKTTVSTGAETVLTLTTHYSVTGVNDPAFGDVVMVTAPTAGEEITIRRKMDYLQNVDLQNQGAYFPETVERNFDRSVMRDQELKRRITALEAWIADLDDTVDGIVTAPAAEIDYDVPVGDIDTQWRVPVQFTGAGDVVKSLGRDDFAPESFNTRIDIKVGAATLQLVDPYNHYGPQRWRQHFVFSGVQHEFNVENIELGFPYRFTFRNGSSGRFYTGRWRAFDNFATAMEMPIALEGQVIELTAFNGGLMYFSVISDPLADSFVLTNVNDANIVLNTRQINRFITVKATAAVRDVQLPSLTAGATGSDRDGIWVEICNDPTSANNIRVIAPGGAVLNGALAPGNVQKMIARYDFAGSPVKAWTLSGRYPV